MPYQKLDPVYDVDHALKLARHLGVIPNVAAQEGRYPQILAVLPGSLAARSGLRSGDRIKAFNGASFARVEDALNVFSQLRFENGLRLTVLRGDREVEIEAPAEAFANLTGPKVEPAEDGRFAVTFQFRAPDAQAVYLAGTFNDWKPDARKMDGPDAQGRFTATLELPPGTYEYKFVINGEDWRSDPNNLHEVGFYNNSVVWVGSRPIR